MFFYLNTVVEASTVCMEDIRKYVLWFVLCVVFRKTISVHTKHHVTPDIFEHHCSRHSPRWTHVTLPFRGIAARPVIIVTCVQSFNVSRSWGCSPHRDGCSWLMPSPCQHLSDKRVSQKSPYEIFFPPYEDECWEWPGLTGGKRAFLSTSMFSGWPYSIWPSYLYHEHAACDCYSPPQLPALSPSCVHHDNCLLWVDCECFFRRHMSVLSVHTTAVMSPLVLTRLSPRCSLSVLGLRSLGIPFLCSLTVPQQGFFFCWAKSSHRSGEETKLYMCSLWSNPFIPLVRFVAVAWVPVRCCAALCLSLPR